MIHYYLYLHCYFYCHFFYTTAVFVSLDYVNITLVFEDGFGLANAAAFH